MVYSQDALQDRARIVHKARYAIGQAEYGEGTNNAGYHRDNVQDAFEELCDAEIILGFAEERFATAGTERPGLRRRVQFAREQIRILMNFLTDLHKDIELNVPDMMVDNVERPAYLSEKIRGGQIIKEEEAAE